MDASHELVFVKDSDRRFLYANQALLDLFPPSRRAGLIGTTGYDDSEQSLRRAILDGDQQAFETGLYEGVVDYKDYRGNTRSVMLRKTRFQDGTGKFCLFGVGRDMTAVLAGGGSVSQPDGMLARFAAVAAHDLSSPLGTANMLIQLARQAIGEGATARASALMSDAEGTVERAARQVQALLQLQKMRQTSLEKQRVDAGELLAHVATSMRASLEACHGLVLYSDLPVILCHPNLMSAVFQNLIENSLKYRSALDPVIKVLPGQIDSLTTLSFQDNGAGMSRSVQDRADEPFVQGDAGSSGLGLGLALCREIVRAHAGFLTISPGENGGTTVTLALPSA